MEGHVQARGIENCPEPLHTSIYRIFWGLYWYKRYIILLYQLKIRQNHRKLTHKTFLKNVEFKKKITYPDPLFTKRIRIKMKRIRNTEGNSILFEA